MTAQVVIAPADRSTFYYLEDGSFDYKEHMIAMTNLVPVYESPFLAGSFNNLCFG
jgi:hypothetical protein